MTTKSILKTLNALALLKDEMMENQKIHWVTNGQLFNLLGLLTEYINFSSWEETKLTFELVDEIDEEEYLTSVFDEGHEVIYFKMEVRDSYVEFYITAGGYVDYSWHIFTSPCGCSSLDKIKAKESEFLEMDDLSCIFSEMHQ